MLRRRLVALALLASSPLPFLALTHRPAQAAVVISLSLGQLVEKSSHVVVGIPKSSSARWEGSRIVTYWSVSVDATMAGPAKPGETVTVATMGGVVDKIGQRVEGEAVLTVGAPMVMFLTPLPAPPKDIPGAVSVVGMSQGAMPVVVGTDKVPRVGVSAGGAKLVPAGSKAPPASVTEPGRAITDVQTDVRAKWASLGRK